MNTRTTELHFKVDVTYAIIVVLQSAFDHGFFF